MMQRVDVFDVIPLRGDPVERANLHPGSRQRRHEVPGPTEAKMSRHVQRRPDDGADDRPA